MEIIFEEMAVEMFTGNRLSFEDFRFSDFHNFSQSIYNLESIVIVVEVIIDNDHNNIEFSFHEKLNQVIDRANSQKVKKIGSHLSKNALIASNEHDKNNKNDYF